MKTSSSVIAIFAFIAFICQVVTAHSEAESCRCVKKQNPKLCYKLADPTISLQKLPSGAKVKCIAQKCADSYVCEEDGSTICVKTVVPRVLTPHAGSTASYGTKSVTTSGKTMNSCTVSPNKGKFSLSAYTVITTTTEITETIIKVKKFNFKVAGRKDCWIFRGENYLAEIHGINDVQSINGLSVDDCEPIKMMCVDSTPGQSPQAIAMFEARGYTHGTGVNSGISFASNDAKVPFLEPDFGPEKAKALKWKDGIELKQSDDAVKKSFEVCPEWKSEFQGKAKPVVVPKSVKGDATILLVFVPPYCDVKKHISYGDVKKQISYARR